MKKLLSIVSVMALMCGILSANVAQACGRCGCPACAKPACSTQQSCPCQPGCTCGCQRLSKEDMQKKIAERQACLFEQLGLTKAQQAKAKVIFDQKMKEVGPVMVELHAKKQALKALEESGFQLTKIEAKKVQKEALSADIAKLREQRKVLVAKYDAAFEAILNDTQKAKWAELKAQRHQKYEQMKKQLKNDVLPDEELPAPAATPAPACGCPAKK